MDHYYKLQVGGERSELEAARRIAVNVDFGPCRSLFILSALCASCVRAGSFSWVGRDIPRPEAAHRMGANVDCVQHLNSALPVCLYEIGLSGKQLGD